MPRIALQISPEAKGAYFADYIEVAGRELSQVCPGILASHRRIAALEFFELDASEADFPQLLKLSFVQGIYALEGELLRPLDIAADYRLHEDFVFGSKFRGKTNERLTQLLINVGLSVIDANPQNGLSVLDPMCGRATTLLWAMRYGLKARGIEQDAKALEDIHRNLKKWSKIHRQKHKLSDGFIGTVNKKNMGKFLDFGVEENSMRVVVGDARNADQIFNKEKFNLIVSDLPYGVQHFTTAQTRNPLTVIEQSIPAWKNCLKKGGAIVLSFNSYNPKRRALIGSFENNGFEILPFSAEHRMSESIVRDVLICKLSD